MQINDPSHTGYAVAQLQRTINEIQRTYTNPSNVAANYDMTQLLLSQTKPFMDHLMELCGWFLVDSSDDGSPDGTGS